MKSNELAVGFAVGALALGVTAWLTMHLSGPVLVPVAEEVGPSAEVSAEVSRALGGGGQLNHGLTLLSTRRRSL